MMNWKDVQEQQKQLAGFSFDYGPLLDEIFAKLPPNALVVELGTFIGCSTVYMAEKLPLDARLFTVDTFDKYAQTTNFFMLAAANFKACGVRDRIHALACRSWEAAALFDDGEVDFVWVDAGHDYNSVRGDLEAWHKKVKPGGILGGHDLSEAGVKLAVDKFCFSAKKTYTVYQPQGWQSWWTVM
jgi:predicted O-methyltransferase YrrM